MLTRPLPGKKEKAMAKDTYIKVIFGFKAPKMKKQFPTIDSGEAYNLDQDNFTLHRLRVRGILTQKEMHNARRRIAQKIASELNNSAKKGQKER